MKSHYSAQTYPLEKYPGFRSPKTGGVGIRYPRRWSQGVLLRMNFDPGVMAMRAVDLAGLPCADAISFAFRVVRNSGSEIVVLLEDDAHPPGDLSVLGQHSVIRRSEIVREPVASAMRVVWSNRDVKVAPGKRIQMLAMVASADEGVRLDALMQVFPSGPDNGMADILRLACDNDLSIELSNGIVPEAIVRRVKYAPYRPSNPLDLEPASGPYA